MKKKSNKIQKKNLIIESNFISIYKIITFFRPNKVLLSYENAFLQLDQSVDFNMI